MKYKLVFTIFLSVFLLVICSAASAANTTYNYTTDDDFKKGNLTGLNVSDNQLQLSNNSSSSNYPFIWVPNSNEGTVSKVNTITGLEIARYRTGPYTYANPSRTTVDLEGSCWVGNRNIGSAVKIGLFENGGYLDRNNNGIIETSRDLNGDGVIMNTKDPVTGADIIEILPWGQDECVLWEVILIPGSEGNYTPGSYKGTYANDYYNPGPRGLAIDSQNNIWIGTYGTQKYYYINGSTGQIIRTVNVSSVNHSPYGAVIDQNGILWSSGNTGNNVLRLDTSNDSFTRINVPHTAYGLALDRNNHLFVSGLNYYRITRINILTGIIEWTKTAAYAQGITVTDDGDIWSANNVQGTVTRYSNNGDIKATIPVGNTPTGVSADNQGKLWVVDNGDEYIHRINPEKVNSEDIVNGIELSKRLVGGTHYGYSDMTGVLSNTITSNKGTWRVIHDSEVNNVLWGAISWNSFEPQGTRITVRARSSNDKTNWSAWEDVTNGVLLGLTPRGRFLEVNVEFERFKGSVSPVLYDLSVRTLSADVTLTNTIDNPTPKLGDTVRFITVVTNTGLDPATNLRIYPQIPTGFTPENPSHGSLVNNVWIVGTLNPGEMAVLEVKGVVTSDLTSRNIVYNASETHEEYDPTPSSSSSAGFYVPVSNIELVSGTVNGKPTLFVRNNGPDHAFNVGVQTSLPGGATSNTSQGFYSSGLWYVGSLASGAVASLSLNFPTSNIGAPVNVVSGYKKTSKRSRYGSKWDYSAQRGNIPPPNRKKGSSVPMQDTGVPLNFSGIAILFIFFAAYLNKNNDKIRPNKWLALFIVLFFALLLVGNVSAADPGTYNSTDDFNKGVYNNVNGSEGKLQLYNSSNSAGNYIWVPNSNQGTVSKVDVRTGQEVARYRTNPGAGASPSRIVVDGQGCCWVSNRVTGSLVKIGLYENKGYIDRNNNGKIETSRDLDNNGIITDNEILNWGQDECVLYEVILIPGKEGVYKPGDYKGGYANYGMGISSLILDADGNIWAGHNENKTFYYINGSNGQILRTVDISSYNHASSYAVMDNNGVIWSGGNNLLRLDTVTGSVAVKDVGYVIYTLALDNDEHLYIYGYYPAFWPNNRFSRLNTTSGNIDWTKTLSYMHWGSILIGSDGDVWLAEYYDHWFYGKTGRLTRYSHNGDVIANIQQGLTFSGLSRDSNGKIWVIDSADNYIHRVDPEINGVDLSKLLPSTAHAVSGTMTSPYLNSYDRGTWNVIHDSGIENAYWGTIGWNGYEPQGTKITVRARSSNDKSSWSAWEDVINGANLRLTPSGRYLDVEVVLERFSGTYLPVVYDLTVKNVDSNVLSADLGITITGNASSLNPGDTVKLTLQAVNNGPNTANVKVNYKIPFGLKLLSSQGQGTYDSSLGVWSIGNLQVGGSAALELVLQAVDSGYFVNVVSVNGDLPVTKSISSTSTGVVRFWSAGASSGMYDPNPGNNGANYGVNSLNPANIPDNLNKYPYNFPDNIVPPTPDTPPTPPQKPDDQNPPEQQPSSRVGQDILTVRENVSAQYNTGDETDYASEFLKLFLEVGSFPDDLLVPPILYGLLKKVMKPFINEGKKLFNAADSKTEYLAAAVLACSAAIIATGFISAMLLYIWYIILSFKSLMDKHNDKERKP
ncbi:MAG: DUF11 domain-containing protein [Methanobacterium sp.]|uniref:virginiamycin B lyase family protein n=1 Tax=Methanobacterium sp. TaxID=2164 RepID=UPI003D654692|nr:DUF11 domain-containing protein [Methanobacterium sp.]